MFLQSVSLQNFRNYPNKVFNFNQNTVLIVGPNASGKTNLLEAIYLLATGRSFRAETEAEMISYGQEMSRVSAEISSRRVLPLGSPRAVPPGNNTGAPSLGLPALASPAASEINKLEIVLTTGLVSGKAVAKKIYKINGVNKRMRDFVGSLRAVYFGPEDLQLVTDSPSRRRRYLDLVLSQVDREYAGASLTYERGLRQRNKILEELQRYRDIELQRGEIKARLDFWDQLLVKNGNYITGKREEFTNFLNKEGKFELEYVRSAISLTALAENFEKEVRFGMTLVGPHRDDIKFKVQSSKFKDGEGRDLSIYGSRGEQRLAVLWLKVGELEFVSNKTGERSLLLLDDIFSELDKENIKLINQMGLIERQQTIITATEERVVPEGREIEIVRV